MKTGSVNNKKGNHAVNDKAVMGYTLYAEIFLYVVFFLT